MCLAQGHNTSDAGEAQTRNLFYLESTTEPLRSLLFKESELFVLEHNLRHTPLMSFIEFM